MCETRVLWHGREFFSLRPGLHNHCFRLRLRPAELVPEVGWRSRNRCQKGSISRSVKNPRAALQAESQKKEVTRTRRKISCPLRAKSALPARFVEAVLWKQRRVPPVMTEGRSAPPMSRTSRINELRFGSRTLPRKKRMFSGDIRDLRPSDK